jgi:hypothetical protein
MKDRDAQLPILIDIRVEERADKLKFGWAHRVILRHFEFGLEYSNSKINVIQGINQQEIENTLR